LRLGWWGDGERQEREKAGALAALGMTIFYQRLSKGGEGEGKGEGEAHVEVEAGSEADYRRD
jgi:hypothetical protein